VYSKKELEKIKESLLKRKRELEQKLTQMAQEQFSDGQVQDPGDQALTSTMESLRTTLQGTELEEYRRLIRAIGKIDEGTYGTCTECSNPISEKRLNSFPDATHCLLCQEALEEASARG